MCGFVYVWEDITAAPARHVHSERGIHECWSQSVHIRPGPEDYCTLSEEEQELRSIRSTKRSIDDSVTGTRL